MKRTGLVLALAVAVVAGVVFAVFPGLDPGIAHLFYNDTSRRFVLGPSGWPEFARRLAMWIAWAFIGPAIFALVVKFIRPRRPLLVPGRAVVFLLSTILLTAILVPNVFFKDHWGRPRPVATKEFHGSQTFKPWWDSRGAGAGNRSFYSGEATTAFWTYAPAALAPPAFRPLAFAAATIFGLATGLLRMAFGAHYASDIIAAGIAAFLITWCSHGLIYRWNLTRISDDRIDQWISSTILKLRSASCFLSLLAAVAVLTVLRIVALKFSVVDLFPDEAQYWVWSRAPAFGYFSKPPLIAWIIAVTSHFFGNSEASLRAASPIFYAGTSVISYFIARHLYNERTAFWAGLSAALATGAVFSARIISTDVPLLFFWALALLAFFKMLDTASLGWSVVLGLALGLGLLAKYAMIYFLPGLVCVSLIDPRARAMWRRPAIWFVLLIAVLVVAPNLIWNATHDSVTFRQTQRNVLGGGLKPNPLGGLGFVASQFAVCGPIVFGVFILALAFPRCFSLTPADRALIAFALPPLVLVTLGACVTSAEANWAAPAAISVILLAAALLVRRAQWRWLQISVAIGLVLQIALIAGDLFADRVSVPFLPDPDLYRRTMGWKTMSMQVNQAAVRNGVQDIAADQKEILVSLLYYLRDDRRTILAWPPPGGTGSGLEPGRQWPGVADEPILFVSPQSSPERLAKYYSSVEELSPVQVATGPHSTRRFFAFKLSGPHGDGGSTVARVVNIRSDTVRDVQIHPH